MFLGKSDPKICSKFTGENLCQNAVSINLLCNFIEIAVWHGRSSVNLLHIFRVTFPKKISGGMLLCNSERTGNEKTITISGDLCKNKFLECIFHLLLKIQRLVAQRVILQFA